MNKMAVVILALVIVIFVIFVTWGSLAQDKPRPVSGDEAVREAKKSEPPSWARGIASLLSGLGEKLELPDAVCLKKSAPGSRRRCDSLRPNVDIEILAEEGTNFRTLELELVSGAAEIDYSDNTPNAAELKLNAQRLTLPDPERKNSPTGSIVALERGGTFKVSCRNNSSCQVGFR